MSTTLAGFVNSFKEPPGINLSGPDRQRYHELSRTFEASINGMMVRPNMEAMLSCSDLVNNTIVHRVLVEFVELIRRRIATTKNTNVLFLLLQHFCQSPQQFLVGLQILNYLFLF